MPRLTNSALRRLPGVDDGPMLGPAHSGSGHAGPAAAQVVITSAASRIRRCSQAGMSVMRNARVHRFRGIPRCRARRRSRRPPGSVLRAPLRPEDRQSRRASSRVRSRVECGGIGLAVHGYSRVLPKGMRPVSDQDQASTARATKPATPGPVTPSKETRRPAGLAFDVEEGADLPGVPVGDQIPDNPHATTAEKGTGVGLAVPEHPLPEQQEESSGG
jgi:hypothetical protein